jgi:hypothetical protein
MPAKQIRFMLSDPLARRGLRPRSHTSRIMHRFFTNEDQAYSKTEVHQSGWAGQARP